MGNSMACFSPAHIPKKLSTNLSRKPSKRSPNSSPFFGSSASTRRTKGSPKKTSQTLADDLMLQQQAIEAVLLFQNHQKNNGSQPFNRSTSVVFPAPGPKKNQAFTKSSSSRQPLVSETLFQPLELVDKQQDVKIDGLETNHFVLVHGGGFGAWCWYKTMTLLEESGFKVDAVDLTGSGIHSFDTNSITSLAQYVKPLTEILENLEEGKKVILVGHDFGGTCISYAMELFPSKIAKAIFISAAMLTSGQSTLNLFAQQTGSNDLMRQAQIFLYANGKDQPPTAIGLGKKFTEDLLFNQSPAKDVALASVSMRPIPFAPVTEKLSLSDKNYGSVRRFFIVTQEDHAISVPLQEAMLESNPPEQFYRLKGSDHAPFFSRPQALHRILVEISQVPPNLS
ncbi:putative methylesterase 11, chloroplastic isoform X1 [Rosa rugosa]|uniref:putative methylesterase 11, chloroplastic isoform X1 n=1 Tax=Rosa rugosa TaxID=74645 RepID=UPI002B406DFA|nr:putative methylesterase 11, chloroplastic isoform X1 [Rosa rugosa]